MKRKAHDLIATICTFRTILCMCVCVSASSDDFNSI